MSYYDSESDWSWLFHNALDWSSLLPLFYPNFPTEDGLESEEEVVQFQEELLRTISQWSSTSIKEKAAKLDKLGAGTIVEGRTIPGVELAEIYREAKDLDLFSLPLPRKYGGMDLPQSPHFIGLTFLARACVSTSTQLAFFSAIGDMLARFGSEDVKERLIPKIAAGEISGSMCLTEPGCGSDVGALKTSATPTGNGLYLLNGSKCFITNGGGGVGLVLARIKGDPEGTEGISMFLAEQEYEKKEGPNFVITKNENKMGMHGSFTTEVVYEDTVATLIGEPRMGFKYMLHLMNGARIGVAFQSLGILEASIKDAQKYAKERIQFGRPINELPLMKRNLKDFDTELRAIRALLVDTASFFDIYQRLELKKLETGHLTKVEKKLFDHANMWTRKRTPLVKYYACEATTYLSGKAIQVLGGYGYMEDYSLERYHRDSFGPLLYEGTSQIQALMALKDLMKYIIKDPGAYFSYLFFGGIISPLEKLPQHKTMEDFSSLGRKLKRKITKLIYRTLKPKGIDFFKASKWTKEEKIERLMIHSETICEGLSYLETLRVLAKHASIDENRTNLYFDYKELVLPRLTRIYYDWEIRQ
ncbi:MAG: hypothetical protein CME68_10260 [Halobacteriovoraceae bacterium]|nr:hypothetical protein [Halobacteriovoraceae bacterium]